MSDKQPIRVLVVDDEKGVRQLVSRMLCAAGYGVVEAKGGRQALDLLADAPFDVLITDIRMNDTDGFELLRVSRERWPGLVCLLMTGWATLESTLEALHLGADDFIPKPFPSPAHLLGAIERALARRESLRRLGLLEQLNQAKDDFINLINHELRTPMTSLKGALWLLNEDAAQLDPEIQEVLGIVSESVDQLFRVIEDLSLLHRLRNEGLKPGADRIDLVELIERSMREVGARYPQQQVVLSMRAGLGERVVIGDRQLLGTALGHLIDNAVKFSPVGDTVEVGLVQERDGLLLEVVDHGPGIPADAATLVFEPFGKLGKFGTDENRGPGLGLPIARRIAELHGGSLTVESDGHSGCRFALRIRACRSAVAQKAG